MDSGNGDDAEQNQHLKYSEHLKYDENWAEWFDIAAHQAPKDRVLFPRMTKWFVSNEPVLELGAGVGQLSLLAQSAGFTVHASDYEAAFVDVLESRDLAASQVDARAINDAFDADTRWATIFSQGASPFVTADLDIVESTYRSVFAALRPGGRLVLLIARTSDPERFSMVADHDDLIARVGFRELHRERNQVLKSSWYRIPGAAVIERLLAPHVGHRDLIVLERPA